MELKKEFAKDKPLYTTAVVASMLDITPDRLRMYDTLQLITSHRIKTGKLQRRLYSQYDIEWLKCLRMLFGNQKFNLASVKFLIQLVNANPKMHFPKNEVGEILAQMSKNPNLKTTAEKIQS